MLTSLYLFQWLFLCYSLFPLFISPGQFPCSRVLAVWIIQNGSSYLPLPINYCGFLKMVPILHQLFLMLFSYIRISRLEVEGEIGRCSSGLDHVEQIDPPLPEQTLN